MKNTFIFTLSLMASFCISQPLNAKDGKEINTNRLVLSTAIESSAEKVWQVMIDFKNYPKWNPWYQIEGEAKVGAWIKAYSGTGQSLDLKITKMDEFTLCWVDVTWFTHLGMGGWRCRSVKPNPNGTGVIFTNHFEYTGPLRKLLKLGTLKMLQQGMHQENQGLKAYMERQLH